MSNKIIISKTLKKSYLPQTLKPDFELSLKQVKNVKEKCFKEKSSKK